MQEHPSTSSGPLHGIRVLELGSLIAGPYASALLAQFGADVIKVEPPDGGDPLREWRKLHSDGTSFWWYSQSRNKKSVTLDLKHDEARELVRRLVRNSDIVIENFRPGTLERWGLGWEQLSAINPRLVMVRVSGYGQTGPYRERPGFAAIAECMGGLRYTSGYPDRPPVRVGVSLGDTLASLYGTIGALLALHHVRGNAGKGQYVDVALYESVFAIMESLVPEYSAQGFVRERSGASLPGISPSNTYVCGDGQYVAIAGNGDGIFSRLMGAIGRNDLAQDPALATNTGRVQHNDRLDAAIAAWTGSQPLAGVLSKLERAEVPAGRVYTAADISKDPHYRARNMIEQHTLPDGTPVELPGIVPKLSETPGRTSWVGPLLGQHTAEVLASVGVGSAELEALRMRGVV
jgi:crotonobetainyl-CoA:carnitine CoA-transferase CaiB-like acyl-CoA transferase